MTRLFIAPILFAIACTESAADRAPLAPEPAAKVELATVTAGPTPEVLTLTGKIVADQRAELTADTQGKVLEVLVDRGQHVKRGQPLLRLDVRGAALSTSEAAANLDAVRTEQALAKIECERAQTLFAKGAISKSELDRTATQCSSAAQHVSAARARTAIYAKGVSDGIVRAPFDGIVSERGVQIGEWVAPGRALFTLVDSDPLRVELTVPETHVPSITRGQPVAIHTVARPGTKYPATITRLAAEIGRTRSLIVEATVTDHRDQLVPGMFVEATVVTGSVNLPVLPATAVVRRGKSWHAFVLAGDALEDRIVQLGPEPKPGAVSIIQNLAAGERVAARITDQITDGLRVEK